MKSIAQKSIVSLIIILMINVFLCSILHNSNADNDAPAAEEGPDKQIEVYYYKVDRAPFITIELTHKNYVKILVTEESGIKDIKIEVKDGKKYKTVNKKYLTISKDKKTIKIDKSFFKVNKTKLFRITASDNDEYSNKSVTTCKLKRLKKKNSKGKYFSINRSPRIYDLLFYYPDIKKAKIYGVYLGANDNSYMKHDQVIDLNNKNKVLEDFLVSDSDHDVSGTCFYIEPKKCKQKNGQYKIKYISTDLTGMKSTEEMYFHLEKTLVDEDNIRISY